MESYTFPADTAQDQRIEVEARVTLTDGTSYRGATCTYTVAGTGSGSEVSGAGSEESEPGPGAPFRG